MTHARLVELLGAIPELDLAEVNRLRSFVPKASRTALAVRLALEEIKVWD